MDIFNTYLNNLVNQNRETFLSYPNLKWLGNYTAAEAQKKRDKLTKLPEANWLFKETKPFHKHISEGCAICGLGKWSCLFITGKCNANCFYCPTPQLADEVPGTQNLNFETPEAYAEYISFFNFEGVSFSGGEPLLFFDRTLKYLEQIRKDCNPEIYIWMYTNGILADEQKFKKLADAGLNEVRFDIGATDYKLDKIKLAKGVIPNITIEIPVVPEEKDRIIKLLPEMIEAGVTNFNLHQLRLTKYNAPKLSKRNYTFIHAEQPIVLESELAALEILKYAKENHLEIGINYCSFFFKNRFQKAGFRKQITNALAAPGVKITEKGYIRNFVEDSIDYKAVVISEKNSGNKSMQELKLKHKSYDYKTENAFKSNILNEIQKKEVEKITETEPEKIPSDELLFKIWQMEYIEKGLREY